MMGARPKSPPYSTLSPSFLPKAGMMRTAVVLLLITPMAISSAMMPARRLATLTEEQTRLVSFNAWGMQFIRRRSASPMPL